MSEEKTQLSREQEREEGAVDAGKRRLNRGTWCRGMDFSPDKMLQARLISCPDAHGYRLGVNYDSLPVNKAQCPVHSYNKDGAMRFDGNGGKS